MPEQQFASYNLICEGVSVPVTIMGQGKRFRYYLSLPKFEPPTLALLDGIKSKLILELDISNIEVFDQIVIDRLKVQFKKRADEFITKEIPTISKASKYHMISRLIRESSKDYQFEYKDRILLILDLVIYMTFIFTALYSIGVNISFFLEFYKVLLWVIGAIVALVVSMTVGIPLGISIYEKMKKQKQSSRKVK